MLSVFPAELFLQVFYSTLKLSNFFPLLLLLQTRVGCIILHLHQNQLGKGREIEHFEDLASQRVIQIVISYMKPFLAVPQFFPERSTDQAGLPTGWGGQGPWTGSSNLPRLHHNSTRAGDIRLCFFIVEHGDGISCLIFERIE